MLREDFSCSLPSQYLIEPTNTCNLKCKFCANAYDEVNALYPKGFMSPGNFKKILDKITPYAKLIYFYDWGEPYLNKDLNTMIKLASDRGIKTNNSSNLSIRDLDHEGIAASGLTNLVVSIDGASQAVYEKYRIGGDLELVLNNIRLIEKAKKRMKKDLPVINWQFLVHKFNEHEQDKAREIANELGIGIFFSKMIVLDETWESATCDDEMLHTYMKASDPAQYEKADRSLPLPVSEVLLHPRLFNVCRQALDLMLINWNGDVFPCCAVYRKEAVIGNVVKQSIGDVWNGTEFKDCRKFLYNYGHEKFRSMICGTVPCWPLSEPLIIKNKGIQRK